MAADEADTDSSAVRGDTYSVKKGEEHSRQRISTRAEAEGQKSPAMSRVVSHSGK